MHLVDALIDLSLVKLRNPRGHLANDRDLHTPALAQRDCIILSSTLYLDVSDDLFKMVFDNRGNKNDFLDRFLAGSIQTIILSKRRMDQELEQEISSAKSMNS